MIIVTSLLYLVGLFVFLNKTFVFFIFSFFGLVFQPFWDKIDGLA